MSNKKRWQKLAGILVEEANEDEEEVAETLQEGFKNLGMATPGIMGGNPFERPGNITKEQSDEWAGSEWDRHEDMDRMEMGVHDAEELLRSVVMGAETGPFDGAPEGEAFVSLELVAKIKHFLEQ